MAITTSAALIAGGAAATVAGLKYMSDREARKAKRKEQKKQRELAEKQRIENITSGDANAERLGKAYETAAQQLTENTEKARRAFAAGDAKAAQVYQERANRAKQELSGGYERARGALAPLTALSHYGEDALTGKGFETSGGYQFRLGQGQQALSRAGAAAGGRLSGAALKRLSEYNQGFASNEYNTWANRASQLGQVGYGAIGRTSDLYGAEGAGLSDIEGRAGAWLGNLYENAGIRQGNLNTQYGSQLANLTTGSATAQANLRTGTAAANQQLTMAMMPTFADPYAGAGWDAAAEGVGTFGTLAMYGMGSGSGGSTTNLASNPGAGYGAEYYLDQNGNPVYTGR